MKKMWKTILTVCFLLAGLQLGGMTAGAAGTAVTPGTYTIKNAGTGKYLNVYGNKNANKTNIMLWQKDGTNGQDFKIYSQSGSYALNPLCSPGGRVVNVYGNTAKNGSNVCLWDRTNHSTQLWKFDKVSGGYVIRCAFNTNLVLNAAGSSNGSNINIATYDKNNARQVWTLEDPATVPKPAPGDTGAAPASQIKITGTASPSSIKVGKSFSLKGNITSVYNLTRITGMILKSDGKTVVSQISVTPNKKSYSLYNSTVDRSLKFNKLAAGTYYYKLQASDAAGKTVVLINQKFSVTAASANSQASSDSQLRTQITNTHAKAKSLAGRNSFNGLCGAYVYWQLRARGIWTGKKSSYERSANGNNWYSMLSNSKYTKSSGGYKLTKYAGKNCLDALSNYGKKDVYNIVVSYKAQYGYSVKNPGAGHVVYIHAIKGGKVYLSESYTYTYKGVKSKEGQPLVINYSDFKKNWNSMYKEALGAVVFTK